MGSLRSAGTLGATVLLVALGAPPPAGAQAAADPARPHKSVYGTLEKADPSLGGVFMKSDKGERGLAVPCPGRRRGDALQGGQP